MEGYGDEAVDKPVESVKNFVIVGDSVWIRPEADCRTVNIFLNIAGGGAENNGPD